MGIWKVCRYGDALQACRSGGEDVWSSGALEAYRRYSDVEVYRCRG